MQYKESDYDTTSAFWQRLQGESGYRSHQREKILNERASLYETRPNQAAQRKRLALEKYQYVVIWTIFGCGRCVLAMPFLDHSPEQTDNY